MKKFICTLVLVVFVNADIHCYTLITVNTNAPAADVDLAKPAILLAGVPLTTVGMPYKKSQMITNVNGSNYIWEVTKTDNIAPTVEYLWGEIESNSVLTHTQVTNLILGISVCSDLAEVRAYMDANPTDWFY